MNLFDLCVYKNLNKESGGDVDVSSLVATENKTYNAGEGKAYNPVVVNVPTPSPSLQSLTASHNGYFVPSSGYDGFSEVTVDVATPLETLSATENGTYTPSSGYEGFSEVTVDVPLPNNAYLLESQKDDVVTIQHGAEFDMPKLIASIEPQQDLHGYDAPWVGGGGKNKLPLPAEQTINGVTLTHLSDGSIKLTGTPTANIYFDCFAGTFDSTAYVGYRFKVSYIGSSSGVSFRISGSNRASMQDLYDNSVIADNGSGLYFALRVAFDATIPSSGIIIYPMLLSSSETNYDFAPYSNECPISGWTACNVVRTGKNLFDKDSASLNKALGWNTGIEFVEDNSWVSGYISVKPSVSYKCNKIISQVFGYDESKTCVAVYYNGEWVTPTSSINVTSAFTVPSYIKYIRFSRRNTSGASADVADTQLEIGTQSTTYEEYNGNTYTINFVDGSSPLTVYKGEFDVLSGSLKVYPHYDSYNGETINGEWISDRDVYAEGTTPTIGAEVQVMSGSDYTTYQQVANNIKSLEGVNNIYADTGEVDVQIWTKEVTL